MNIVISMEESIKLPCFIFKFLRRRKNAANTLSIMTFSITTLSIMTFSMIAEHCYAVYQLCWLSLLLSVTNKPFMLFVIMLNVVMLSVVAPKEFTSCRYETSFQVDVSRRRSHFVEFYDVF